MPEPVPEPAQETAQEKTARETARETARRSADLMMAEDAASRALGMRLLSVAPGSGEVAMTVREDMVNGHGSCHGGLIATLADTAFAVACNSHGRVTVAAGFDIAFLEPGRVGDELLATAREVSLRGRSGIYDVTVRRTGGDPGSDVVIAEFRGRSRSLGRPGEGGPSDMQKS